MPTRGCRFDQADGHDLSALRPAAAKVIYIVGIAEGIASQPQTTDWVYYV